MPLKRDIALVHFLIILASGILVTGSCAVEEGEQVDFENADVLDVVTLRKDYRSYEGRNVSVSGFFLEDISRVVYPTESEARNPGSTNSVFVGVRDSDSDLSKCSGLYTLVEGKFVIRNKIDPFIIADRVSIIDTDGEVQSTCWAYEEN